MRFNDIVRSVFEGYKEAKDQRDPFGELEKAWCLYGVDDLNGLLGFAKTKEQHELILDHMYQFDATRVGYYKNIETKIINHYWEG
ncbi:hypothetical protein J7E79_02615 [Bacillus sp. ISL-40]|uniref:hypothetical protein n=1 Tax=unclassified Bacillus (in: firmicutes) TaxID=185979 RepID=UPI001BEA691E|nr:MULTISPECIES: hypothetical protein [unclassified Bacillus (in: firmicutes)]MBT2696328.1 hypothetical protein [Bacillus sp. ISL-40]MBT2743177.1 hypothetical protein [Bacillus sp. ISL-77]